MSKNKTFCTKTDILIILFFCILGIAMTVWIYRPQTSDATHVEVRQDGKLLYTLPLAENIDKEFSDNNGNTNHFKIQDKEVIMLAANCGDQTCVKTRGITDVSQSIVCLPHRLTLTICSGNNHNQNSLDAIVQ